MRNKFLATTSLVFAAALAFSAPANANGVGTTVDEALKNTSAVQAWVGGDVPDMEVTYSGPVFEMVATHHLPPVAGLSKIIAAGYRNLEKMSDGKIKVNDQWGATVHSVREGRRATRTGLSHFAPCFSLYTAKDYTTVGGMGLPFLLNNAHEAVAVAEELYPKYFKDEFEQYGVVIGRMAHTSPYHLFTKDTAVRKLEDVKGLKVRAGGGTHAAIIGALGATQTSIPGAEAYTAMQRGIVDAIHFGDAIAPVFKVHEIAKFRTTNGFNVLTIEYCASSDFFNDLPKDLQLVYNAWARQMAQADAQGFYSVGDVKGLIRTKEAGVEVIDMPAAELDRWKAAVAPLTAKWIANEEKNGRPGQAFIDDVKALSAKYSAMSANDMFQLTVDSPNMGMYDFK
jgi:TRAP-type C4-dicarboxylate transport system substrate-binding protein